MFQTKFVEKIKTHILFLITFFENHAVYEIMWENIVEPGWPQMAIWRTRIACWITKATDTLSICNTYCIFTATMVTRTLPVLFFSSSPTPCCIWVSGGSIVLNFGVTVLFDVTHFARLVQFHNMAAQNRHMLCPNCRHARCDSTSIIALFSALSFSNKWLHPLPSTACLLSTLPVLMFCARYSWFCLLFAIFALLALAVCCFCFIHHDLWCLTLSDVVCRHVRIVAKNAC